MADENNEGSCKPGDENELCVREEEEVGTVAESESAIQKNAREDPLPEDQRTKRQPDPKKASAAWKIAKTEFDEVQEIRTMLQQIDPNDPQTQELAEKGKKSTLKMVEYLELAIAYGHVEAAFKLAEYYLDSSRAYRDQLAETIQKEYKEAEKNEDEEGKAQALTKLQGLENPMLPPSRRFEGVDREAVEKIVPGTKMANDALEQGMYLLLLAAEKGWAEAQFKVGQLLHLGTGPLEKDTNDAQEYYKLAVAQDHAEAMAALGGLLLESGEVENLEEAIKHLQRGADGGSAIALWQLGGLFCDGYGVKRDDEKCFTLVKLAVENGELVEAQHQLGQLYYHGRGTEVNLDKAVEHVQSAADAGLPAALLSLGLLHLRGEGVEQNREEAQFYLVQAADQGHHGAIFNLGVMMVEDKRYELAHHLFSEAAPSMPDAYFNLAVLTKDGMGCEKDFQKAREFAKLALDNGIAEERIKELEELIAADEAQEAEQPQIDSIDSQSTDLEDEEATKNSEEVAVNDDNNEITQSEMADIKQEREDINANKDVHKSTPEDSDSR